MNEPTAEQLQELYKVADINPKFIDNSFLCDDTYFHFLDMKEILPSAELVEWSILLIKEAKFGIFPF